MRRRRCTGIGLVFLVAIVTIGCDEVLDPQPSIAGRVTLHDELGNTLATADGVEVNALSVSSVRRYQAWTDAEGWFEIELPEDEVVPLMFTRQGFGPMFRFDVDDQAGLIEVDMFATSSAVVTSVTAEAESCGSVNCLRLALEVDDFFGEGMTRRVLRLYLSTDPEVDLLDYQVTDLLFVPEDHPGIVRTGTAAAFELDGLHGLLGSFGTGTTVHVVVYGATENQATGYPNPANGQEIFTDLSPDFARTSFVVP